MDNTDKYFVLYLIAENVAIETANTAGRKQFNLTLFPPHDEREKEILFWKKFERSK